MLGILLPAWALGQEPASDDGPTATPPATRGLGITVTPEAGVDTARLQPYRKLYALVVGIGDEKFGYLVPWHGTMTRDRVLVQDIDMDQFRNLVHRRLAAKHKCVVVDACYSGILAARAGAKSERFDRAWCLLASTYVADVDTVPGLSRAARRRAA